MEIKIERIPVGPEFQNYLDVTSCMMTRDEFIDRYGWDAMPKGPFEEDDGSVWRIIEAENPELEGRKWRWQPLNWTAFGKGEPTGILREPFHMPDEIWGDLAKRGTAFYVIGDGGVERIDPDDIFTYPAQEPNPEPPVA